MAEFKTLVATNFWAWSTIHRALYDHDFDSSSIPVAEHEGKIYGLRPSMRTLYHEPNDDIEEADTGFRQLAREHTDKPLHTDSFIKLGHLIELDGEDPSAGRLTNYKWALNVITDPVSLWLIYDYLARTELGEEYITNISGTIVQVLRSHTHRIVAPPTMDSWALVRHGTW